MEETRKNFSTSPGSPESNENPDYPSQWRKKRLCYICGKFFKGKMFTSHIDSHFQRKKFKCEICDKSFGTKICLQRHTLVHTGDKIFSCDICGNKFGQRVSLHRHKKNVHKIKSPVCNICEKSFQTKESLQNHKTQVHESNGPKQYICKYCGRVYMARSSWRIHIRRKHEREKMLDCRVCGMKVAIKSELQKHMERHDSVEIKSQKPVSHQCSQCKQNCNNIDALLVHQRVCSLNRYHCGMCEKKFWGPLSLKQHMTKEHLNKNTKTINYCDICKKYFKKPCKLKYHMSTVHAKTKLGTNGDTTGAHQNATLETKSETGVQQNTALKTKSKTQVHKSRPPKLSVCKYCDRVYMARSSLWGHIRRKHEREKMLDCRICGLEVAIKSDLQKHMSTVHARTKLGTKGRTTGVHQNATLETESKTKIDQNATLKTKSKTRVDQNTTLETKSNTGRDQDTTSKTKSKTQVHKSRQPKLSVCKYCDRVFVARSSLWGHIRRKHEREKMLDCHICGLKVAIKSDLQKHMSTVHARTKLGTKGGTTGVHQNATLETESKTKVDQNATLETKSKTRVDQNTTLKTKSKTGVQQKTTLETKCKTKENANTTLGTNSKTSLKGENKNYSNVNDKRENRVLNGRRVHRQENGELKDKAVCEFITQVESEYPDYTHVDTKRPPLCKEEPEVKLRKRTCINYSECDDVFDDYNVMDSYCVNEEDSNALFVYKGMETKIPNGCQQIKLENEELNETAAGGFIIQVKCGHPGDPCVDVNSPCLLTKHMPSVHTDNKIKTEGITTGVYSTTKMSTQSEIDYSDVRFSSNEIKTDISNENQLVESTDENMTEKNAFECFTRAKFPEDDDSMCKNMNEVKAPVDKDIHRMTLRNRTYINYDDSDDSDDYDEQEPHCCNDDSNGIFF